MSLNEDILNTLKCTTCSNYLLHPPLYLTPECNNICGKCPIPEDAIRNLAFERVVGKISFPCKNEQFGCQFNMVAEELLKHENTCLYQRFSCPVSPNSSCKWVGKIKDVFDHCESEHKQFILNNNPFRLGYMESKTKEDFFIMSEYKALFVIQYKQDLEKFMLNIVLLDNKCLHFKYTLEITNNENKYIRKQIILPAKTFKFDENSININLQSIKDFIGSLDTTEFNITINNVNNDCTKCSKEEIDKTEKRFCKFKYKGCNFEDNLPKIDKHEDYFCIYNTWCYICNYYIDITKLEHLISHKNITYKCDKFISITKCNLQQILILNCKFGNLVCCLDTTDSFYIEIYSNLESVSLFNFKIEIVLKNQCGTQTIKKTLDICHENQYDWCIEVPENEFKILFTTNHIFLMNITICMK